MNKLKLRDVIFTYYDNIRSLLTMLRFQLKYINEKGNQIIIDMIFLQIIISYQTNIFFNTILRGGVEDYFERKIGNAF